MNTLRAFFAQLFAGNQADASITPLGVQTSSPTEGIAPAAGSVSILGFVPSYGSHAPVYSEGTDPSFVARVSAAQQVQATNIRNAGGVVDPQQQWQHNVMPYINAVNEARANNLPVPGSYRAPEDVQAEAVAQWNSGAGAYIARQNAARGFDTTTQHSTMHATDSNEGGF